MSSAELRRLAQSSRFDLWRTDELKSALVSVENELRRRRAAAEGRPRAISIRLQIYRQRLQRELDRRSAGEATPAGRAPDRQTF
jgi:hypothetical protein